MSGKQRIGVLTSGGDAPGMNAAVRAVVRMAIARDCEAVAIRHGYEGLLDGDFVTMELGSVGGVLDRGGTFIGTSRSERMFTDEGLDLGARQLADNGVTGLVVIGGDGSYRAAEELARRGVKVIGVPGTIDNDIDATDTTIGFDTAQNTICDATSKVRDTASSHERTFIIEVMGRTCGMLALYSGLAAGADVILVPEVPWRLEDICASVAQGIARGKKHSIILVAEGAAHAFGLAEDLGKACGHQVRAVVLGHIQRGGSPSAFDRTLASRMGAAATEALLDGESGKAVCLQNADMALETLAVCYSHHHEMKRHIYDLAMVLAR
jgi:6-phosphofructokinase 1